MLFDSHVTLPPTGTDFYQNGTREKCRTFYLYGKGKYICQCGHWEKKRGKSLWPIFHCHAHCTLYSVQCTPQSTFLANSHKNRNQSLIKASAPNPNMYNVLIKFSIQLKSIQFYFSICICIALNVSRSRELNFILSNKTIEYKVTTDAHCTMHNERSNKEKQWKP